MTIKFILSQPAALLGFHEENVILILLDLKSSQQKLKKYVVYMSESYF